MAGAAVFLLMLPRFSSSSSLLSMLCSVLFHRCLYAQYVQAHGGDYALLFPTMPELFIRRIVM